MKTDSYINITDEALVAAIVKDKDVSMFGLLYKRYSNIVYNKCLQFARSEEEAKDLTQEVFLKLYIKLGTFKGASKFSTWLYAFTYNTCVNYVTRDKEKRISDKSDELDANDNLLVEPNDYSLMKIQAAKLNVALAQISEESKMILLLKYQDDLTVKEIATVLKLGESAVKIRIKRAKA